MGILATISIALLAITIAILLLVRRTAARAWDRVKVDEQVAAFRTFLLAREKELRLLSDLEAFLDTQRRPMDYYYLSGRHQRAKRLRAARFPPVVISYDEQCHKDFQNQNLDVWADKAKTLAHEILSAAPETKYVSISELQGAIDGSKGTKWREHNMSTYLAAHGLSVATVDSRSQTIMTELWEERAERNALSCEANLTRFSQLFDTVDRHPLTGTQRQAVVVDEDTNLVVAGAGTGKTSVITAKVCYLIEAQLAEPSEILVMAYNRKAAQELQERVSARLGKNGPQIATFHSVGLQMLRDAGFKNLKVAEWTTGTAIIDWMRETFQKALRDPNRRERTIEFLTMFGTKVVDDGGYGDTFKTYQGWEVRSRQEKHISDWLFLNGYWADYEKQYAENTSIKYNPDWTIAHGVYLEHFGIDRAGNTRDDIDAANYRREMQWKRQHHAQHGTRLLETFSYQFTEGTWQTALQSQLQSVRKRRQTNERHNEFVDQLLRHYLDRAAQLCTTFLSLTKNAGINVPEIRVPSNQDPYRMDRDQAFLSYFSDVYDDYEQHLRNNGEIDFADMCNQATRAIREERYRPSYKYVLIDEFQDITRARAEFVASVLRSRRFARLFAVGDDWQSIYRFAGGEVSIMTKEFPDYFGSQTTCHLDTAFRYTPSIGRVASEFVQRNPIQFKKGVEQVKPEEKPGILMVHYQTVRSAHRNAESRSSASLSLRDALRRVAAAIDDDVARRHGPVPADVLVLGRQQAWRREEQHCRPSRGKVRFSTVHAAKGLEADYVIVLGLKDGNMAFPSDATDDPVLELARPGLAEMQFGEERRLFYVALTRAKRRVYLMVDIAEPSPFADEIFQIGRRSGDVALMA